MIVLLLSALDQTIVSTAMPRIIAELQGLERIAWVGTAYLLASTVTVPIYGKLGDLYGRRPILVFGVVVFLLGSMLCGLAGEFGPLPLVGDGMNQLIVCRALQGIGAGALTTGAFATVADIVPPAERGKLRRAVRRDVRLRQRRRPGDRRRADRARDDHPRRPRRQRLALRLLRQPAARRGRAVDPDHADAEHRRAGRRRAADRLERQRADPRRLRAAAARAVVGRAPISPGGRR